MRRLRCLRLTMPSSFVLHGAHPSLASLLRRSPGTPLKIESIATEGGHGRHTTSASRGAPTNDDGFILVGARSKKRGRRWYSGWKQEAVGGRGRHYRSAASGSQVNPRQQQQQQQQQQHRRNHQASSSRRPSNNKKENTRPETPRSVCASSRGAGHSAPPQRLPQNQKPQRAAKITQSKQQQNVQAGKAQHNSGGRPRHEESPGPFHRPISLVSQPISLVNVTGPSSHRCCRPSSWVKVKVRVKVRVKVKVKVKVKVEANQRQRIG